MSKRNKNKRLEQNEVGRKFAEATDKYTWSGKYIEVAKKEQSYMEADLYKYYTIERPIYPNTVVIPEPEKPKYIYELTGFVQEHLTGLKDDLYPFLYYFTQKQFGIGKYAIIMEFATLSGYKFIQLVEFNEYELYLKSDIERMVVENLISAIALRTRTKDEIKARAVL